MQKVIEFNDFNFRFYRVRDSDIYCPELPFFLLPSVSETAQKRMPAAGAGERLRAAIKIKNPLKGHGSTFGSPASRVVKPYVAKRQAAKRHRTPAGFGRRRFRSDGEGQRLQPACAGALTAPEKASGASGQTAGAVPDGFYGIPSWSFAKGFS
ncbi:hypothetical protein [Pantoea sp. DY-5]|uniref:hypothetical protein n=1 Tax=Pantoea sp. DY-5 TaxID=2871488 RepID=UPI001C9644AD|nr:hypothetical protein [Pantoea sp. DY-5]MBY4841161.1 hypothetical protein [Pantoea sp. DY-5]